MKKITKKFLNELQQKALSVPRKRSHYNLHLELSDSTNRLCISLSKGTYIRPHRHSDKWELILALQGEIQILIYDDQGVVIDTFVLSCDGDVSAFEMPANTWHSMFPITGTATFFEVKPGPYIATVASDFALWAPVEGDTGVEDFLGWSDSAVVGDKYIGRI